MPLSKWLNGHLLGYSRRRGTAPAEPQSGAIESRKHQNEVESLMDIGQIITVVICGVVVAAGVAVLIVRARNRRQR